MQQHNFPLNPTPISSSLHTLPSQITDQYSQEIQSEYKNRPQLHKLSTPFIVEHSDNLHLFINKQNNIITKSVFRQGQIIMEIRGKVAYQENVKNYILGMKEGSKGISNNNINKGVGYDGCLGPLLWVCLKEKILMRPIGMGEILVRSSMKNYSVIKQKVTDVKQKGNCCIEDHYGSKLLVKASDIISKGQKLTLKKQSLQKYIYI